MQTTARPGGTDRTPPTTTARISLRRCAARSFGAAALLLAGLFAAPDALHAQRSDAASGEDVTARMAVEPVVTVSPRGPVDVRFPSPGDAAARSEQPVEARTGVRLACAGNTAHEARIRLVSAGERPSSSGPGGELQWTTDRRDGWTPLREEPARVAGVLEAGWRGECATVRFRWVPGEAGPAARPPRRVSVAFEGESVTSRRADAGDDRAQ